MRATANVLVAAAFALALGAPLRAQVLGWARCYDGPGDDWDTALAVTVDSAGHVYVTGGSVGAGTDFDYATVKYDADGDSLWVRRFNGPENGFDLGWALLPDPEGNVYVTGAPVTIKYSPDGGQLWAHENDAEFVRLALDRDGNVVAAGTGFGDARVTKLDPDGGVLWERVYDGPTHDADEGNDMALDSEGNIVVTGQSWGLASPADGTQWNYATVKLDGPTGDTLWTRLYNGPAAPLDVPTDLAFAIAVDDADHVYVSGWSDGVADRPECLTLKYGPSGDVLWERRYTGGGACYDLLYDGGSLYAAARGGGGDRLLKYDVEGELLWARLYATEVGFATNDPRLAADSAGNVYMTSLTEGNLAQLVVLKYTPEGERVWEYRYPVVGANTTSAANDLVVDGEDNVYVAGENAGSECPGGSYDYLTLELSQPPTGTEPEGRPSGYALGPSNPNPSRTTTAITYALPSPAHVTLRVYDVLGRAVRTLVDEPKGAGTYRAAFDAVGLPGGVYFYRMEAGAFAQTRSLTLLR